MQAGLDIEPILPLKSQIKQDAIKGLRPHSTQAIVAATTGHNRDGLFRILQQIRELLPVFGAIVEDQNTGYSERGSTTILSQ